LIIGIGTARSTDISLHRSTKSEDLKMTARLTKLLDRTALTIFLAVAAVPVFCFPLLAVHGIH
jgi:hypothetical protein